MDTKDFEVPLIIKGQNLEEPVRKILNSLLKNFNPLSFDVEYTPHDHVGPVKIMKIFLTFSCKSLKLQKGIQNFRLFHS